MDTQRNDDMEVPDLRTWRFGRRRRSPVENELDLSSITLARLPLWVTWLVGASCVFVPMLFATAMFLTWDGLGRDSSEFWLFCVAPPLAVTAIMCVWIARRGDLSGVVRAAVLVPIVHVVFTALCWFLWDSYSDRIEGALDRLPLVNALPAPKIALGLGALVIVGALVPRGRRHRGKVPVWLRASVSFALAHVLLLGLWLPIAAVGWQDLFTTHIMPRGVLELIPPRAVEFAQIALIPPTVGALVFAVVSTAWPESLRTLADKGGLLLALGLFIALGCRLLAEYTGFVAYANMVHVLLADAIFCLLCVVALGLAHARVLFFAARDAGKAAPWVQRGVIEAERDATGTSPDAVGVLRHLGWLHGLRGRVRRFWLRTANGRLDVPADTRLIAPMPLASTFSQVDGARLGDDFDRRDSPLLHTGDEVVVSGYVEPAGDGVYRRHALPVPGPHGLVITCARAPKETVWRDIQLIMWRPCVLYLLVVSAAALPGMVVLALL